MNSNSYEEFMNQFSTEDLKKLQQQSREDWKRQYKKAPTTISYQAVIKRRYRDPKSHPSFEHICRILSIQSELAINYYDFIKYDFVNNIAGYASTFICHKYKKFFWLSESLFDSFSYIDIPNGISDLPFITPLGVIILPKSKLFTPEGEAVNFIGYVHMPIGYKESPLKIGSRFFHYEYVEGERSELCTFTVLDSGTIYGSGSSFKSGLNDRINGDWRPNPLLEKIEETDIEADQAFLRKIDHIVLNCILLLATKPEYLEESEASSSSNAGKGFANTKKQVNNLLNPLWIGRNYVIKKKDAVPNTTGKKVQMHIRRGHFQSYKVGQGRTQTKWVLKEPIWVNKED